ncbi:uncharacterized protein G2W53_014965 [Senna tora]|uniref:Uncharacterized protein n=1 Tax=Senna tora TaxID=362788 RepID=A0A834WUM0_9FABA|nr:uncharacterized protein G2W53_014965 [Senna tora]
MVNMTLEEVEIEIVHQKDPVRARITITAKLNFKRSSVNLCLLLGVPTMKESDNANNRHGRTTTRSQQRRGGNDGAEGTTVRRERHTTKAEAGHYRF